MYLFWSFVFGLKSLYLYVWMKIQCTCSRNYLRYYFYSKVKENRMWLRCAYVVGALRGVQRWPAMGERKPGGGVAVAGLVSVVEGQEPVEDLALLGLCSEHSIITVGSFGWWAAYLRAACRRRWLQNANVPTKLIGKVSEGSAIEGETLYYADFCHSTTKYYEFYCANERLPQYIPPGWQPYE